MEFFDGKIHGKYMGNTSKMEVLMGNSMENTRTSHINGDVNGEIWEKQLKIEVLMGTSYENIRPPRINEIFIRKCSHKNVHLFLKIHRGFSSKPCLSTRGSWDLDLSFCGDTMG